MNDQLIPHLFRSEYGKIVAAISHHFGLHQMEMAEDIASETFLKAMESWPYHGLPANPTAWLYTVAKCKALNSLRKAKTGDKIHERLAREISGEVDVDFTPGHISDSQLRLLFALCHPSLSFESQVALALKTLCGLSMEEIATAFLTNRETINKRLVRARNKLRTANIRLEITESEITERLPAVLQTIYLLFSEGYYSENHDTAIRPALCAEALNLGYLLLHLPVSCTHDTFALMALLCFQASRLEARISGAGAGLLYHELDQNLWDDDYIQKGFEYLQLADNKQLTGYYLQASIAFWYTQNAETPHKWENILQLYDLLTSTDQSPVLALNRLYALYQVKGPEEALQQAFSLDLPETHFYYLLLAELVKQKYPSAAVSFLRRALDLCKATHEKQLILQKIDLLESEIESFRPSSDH